MDTPNVLATVALGGAIATDVLGTFVTEIASRRRDRRLWITAAGIFLASTALLALALVGIPTSLAEGLYVALGTAAVAVIAMRRGEDMSARKAASLALLVLGVVVLQLGAGHG
jgi:small multidrug resistance pump